MKRHSLLPVSVKMVYIMFLASLKPSNKMFRSFSGGDSLDKQAAGVLPKGWNVYFGEIINGKAIGNVRFYRM